MSQVSDRLCPWCQTEIVWDPEIGPEETCPHCLNELGEYRSVNVNITQTGHQIMLDDEDDDEDDYEDDFDISDFYDEGVQRLLDNQEEAPECPSCHSFMLLAGSQKAPADFVPFVHDELGAPLLSPAFSVHIYVCPSCFKTEQQLSESDRLAMIDLLKQYGNE